MQIINEPITGFGYLTPDEMPPKYNLRTVSGTPPLTITNAKVAVPHSITIYGNTVNDAGVGDRTVNLCPVRRAYRGTFSTKTTVTPGIKYTLSGDYSDNTTHYFNLRICDSDENILESWNGRCFTDGKGSCSFTPSTAGTVWINGWTSTQMMCNIMIVEGTSAEEYEPYGYRIPLLITGNNQSCSYNIFSDTCLFNDDVLTLTPDTLKASRNTTDISSIQNWKKILPLYRGENIISVNTQIQPSAITIQY